MISYLISILFAVKTVEQLILLSTKMVLSTQYRVFPTGVGMGRSLPPPQPAEHLLAGHVNFDFIDVQHSRKAVFSFEKGLNHQNHSSDSLYLVKYPPSKISNYPHTLPLFGNPCSRTIDTPPHIYGFSDKFI